jgi:hypothetical protein
VGVYQMYSRKKAKEAVIQAHLRSHFSDDVEGELLCKEGLYCNQHEYCQGVKDAVRLFRRYIP